MVAPMPCFLELSCKAFSPAEWELNMCSSLLAVIYVPTMLLHLCSVPCFTSPSGFKGRKEERFSWDKNLIPGWDHRECEDNNAKFNHVNIFWARVIILYVVNQSWAWGLDLFRCFGILYVVARGAENWAFCFWLRNLHQEVYAPPTLPWA